MAARSIQAEPSEELLLNGSYDPFLVVLSLVVAIFASYTALDLANGVSAARGRSRGAWLTVGAVVMGTGIWSMHFVGMLAFRMRGMPIAYDVPLMTLSVGVAILASGLALFVVSRSSVSLPTLLASAAFMGIAIAGMHYIGMWSMRMPAVIEWRSGLVATSIAIAIAASFAALWLAFQYRFDRSRRARRVRLGGGVAMGFAISGMHYTAMAAAVFVHAPGASAVAPRNVLATEELGIAVTGTTLFILVLAIAGLALGRELARRAAIADENARLYREAQTAREEAEALADELQQQTAHLQEQAGELEALNIELAATEGRLRGFIDSALDAMVAIDATGTIIEWSRNAEAVFGWSAAEALGRGLTETIIPAQYRERHRQGIARFLATGEGRLLNRRVEITALTKDEREIPVELAITPVRFGSQVLFTSFIRDITEQKNAEAQRRESEQRDQLMRSMEIERARLSELFEQAPAFIAVLQGPEHVVELRNTRYDQLVGHRDILGKPIREVLPELETQGFVKLLDRVYASGEPHVGVGAHVRFEPTADAEAIEAYVNFVCQPISGPEGVVTGIFVHGVDVSDIVRAREEAEAASQAKNEFLSRMSHELRTPLNAILGFGQLLELEVVTQPNRESAQQIVRAGNHLLALIDEVLDIARIEAGQLSLSVEPVKVANVLRESLDLVQLTAANQDITLSAGEALASAHFVVADQQRLKQVLLNLLSNAIKYNRRGGAVTVICEEAPGGRLRLVIQDSGYGISPHRLGRLFTPFDRLGAEQSSIPGSGLGLALSRRIMEAMGGSLGVESVEGQGSRFWAELPITTDVPAAHPTYAVASVDPSRELTGTRHTVLVVEDNLANVRLMERIFQRRPEVRLLTAMQGRLGLELAREHRPDLIILDLNLPDLAGDKVLLAIRQDPELRDIPVFMISGDAIPSQVKRVLDLGAQAYLTKPFNLNELFRLVDDNLPQTDELAQQP